MPLPLPNLDTRRWVDLVEEGRALIPRYAPGWTDHNIHDPGLTLMELLAWLVERDVYRLNRVPESHRRKFLALLGVTPRPAQAATAVLGLAPPGPDPVEVPVGAEFTATTAAGRTCSFCAVEALQAIPTSLQALWVQSGPDQAPQERSRLWREQQAIAAFSDHPVAGAALWLGFDRPWPAGQPVRLAFTFGGGRSGLDERQRILEEVTAQQAAGRPPLPPRPPCAVPLAQPEPVDPWQHHSVRLVWEFYTEAETWQALDPAAGQVSDETRAFTLDGAVEIQLPAPMGPLNLGSGQPLHYVRVRLAQGEYDAPPLLAGVTVNALRVEQAAPLYKVYTINAGSGINEAAPAVPGTARLTMQLDQNDAISALAFVATEAVPEVQVLFYQPATPNEPGLIVLELILLGRSDGRPNQRFRLPQAVVQAGSLEIYTLEPAEPDLVTWRAWPVKSDLDAATGCDSHVWLNETTAEISFGDGQHGHIPPADTPVLARYQATAADLRNVSAGRISSLAPTWRNWLLFNSHLDPAHQVAAFDLKELLALDPSQVWQERGNGGYSGMVNRLGIINQPHPAGGGAAAETVTHTAGRAFMAWQSPTRAITAGDYETLALATPGTVIARAHALPGRHPAYPGLAAPGVVTVMVVPAQRRPQPKPSPGLLSAVRRYLNRRRLAGTHVEVVGPGYVTVKVTARVKLLPGASPPRVQADIVAALNVFLDPLTGGPAALASLSRRPQPPASLLPATGATAPSLAPGVSLLASASLPASDVPAPAVPLPGWPFGRDVYRAEILQVIDNVAGVDSVLSLELSGDGRPAWCGNICVGPTELVAPGRHQIEVM